MGSLKPGATYVYERANGITYAREMGADPSTRTVIGYDLPAQVVNKSTVFGVPVDEMAIYIDMHEAAKSNPSLQEALERAKILYYLSKDNGI